MWIHARMPVPSSRRVWQDRPAGPRSWVSLDLGKGLYGGAIGIYGITVGVQTALAVPVHPSVINTSGASMVKPATITFLSWFDHSGGGVRDLFQ